MEDKVYIEYRKIARWQKKFCRLASECEGLNEIIVDIETRKQSQVFYLLGVNISIRSILQIFLQPGKDIREIYICHEFKTSFSCPTYPVQVCLKQHDCKHTFDLIKQNDNEALNKTRKCTYNEDLTTTSYYCNLPKLDKPNINLPPLKPATTTKKPQVSNENARDKYFKNLRQICGKPGKH